MKPIYSKLWVRMSAFCISFVLFLVSVFPVQATKTVTDLENKTSGLESELSDLNKELDELEKDLDDILSRIQKTSSELEKTKEELAIAIGKEEAQYESMMLRIKYMYENGNLSMVEMLLTSSCIAEFISRAEYIIQISNYDRNLLNEFSKNRELIAEKEAKLEKDQAYLSSLQDELDSKEQELKTKISSTSKDLSDYIAKLEDARDEAERAKQNANKPVEPVIPESNSGSSGNSGNSSNSSDISSGTGVSYTAEDVELLAALIECEAGSTNYQGMLAVGSVVVNRMKHYKFPNTLYGVVYHPRQFSPAHDGKLDKVLNRGAKSSCVDAATDALNGKNNVGSCLYFRAASSGYKGTVIGGNVFY